MVDEAKPEKRKRKRVADEDESAVTTGAKTGETNDKQQVQAFVGGLKKKKLKRNRDAIIADLAAGSDKSKTELKESGELRRLSHENQKKKKAETKKVKNMLSDDERTVIIGGLPFSCAFDAMMKEAMKFGPVQKLTLPKDKATGRIRGFAFITFSPKARGAIERALNLDGSEFMGRRVTARMAGAKPGAVANNDAKKLANSDDDLKVFVGGLPHDIKESKLQKHFSKVGEIASLKLPLNDAGKPKGFAFITFSDTETAAKAVTLNGSELQGKTIVVRTSGAAKPPQADKGDKGKGRRGTNPELTVFANGFPYHFDDAKLRKTFEACGFISNLKLPMLQDESASRGFAFISFDDKSSVEKALKLDGKQLEDRYMCVKMSDDPLNKPGYERPEQAVKQKGKGKGNQQKESGPGSVKTKSFAEAHAEIERKPKDTGAIQKSEGKQVIFSESDDDDE